MPNPSSPPPPGEHARSGVLALRRIAASRLVRISRFDRGEPYFGRSGANRFDCPLSAPQPCYAVSYFGLDLVTAIAETLLHDDVAVDGGFELARDEWERRFVLSFGGSTLVLADLTGAAAKRAGCDGRISTEIPPSVAQQWSAAIHANPIGCDGIYYVSHQLSNKAVVAVFD